MTEEWRPIAGFEGAYEISSLGRLRSIDRVTQEKHWKGKIFRDCKDNNGYVVSVLCYHGKRFSVRRHRLVAETFIDNPDGKTDVNHINGNKCDNRIENLEWTTHRENTDHSWRIGLTKTPPKEETKPVEMLKDGSVVARYSSIKNASEKTGIDSTSICKCCKGKRNSAGGFIWKYKEEIV